MTDTQGVAALLYAALTGYWPGTEETSLPSAPQADGAPCTPRQVSPEVSPPIDAVICRGLLQRSARHEPPIVTPSAFADALAAVAPPVPLPEPAQTAWQGGPPTAASGYPGNPNEQGSWTLPAPGQGPYRRRQPGPERSPATRGVVSVVIVLVLVAIAATAWMISSNLHSGTASATGSQTPTGGTVSPPAATADTVLKVTGDSSYNVEDPSGPGNTEDASRASLAIDGNPSTAWTTAWYYQPNFGGIKPGAGLILNMGRPVKLSQVEVLFGSGGTSADIYLGNNGALTKAAFSTFTKVASTSGASGDYKFNANSSATGQYVVIWLTNLPPSLPSSGNPGGTYQGLIYQITVRGTDAPAAG